MGNYFNDLDSHTESEEGVNDGGAGFRKNRKRNSNNSNNKRGNRSSGMNDDDLDHTESDEGIN
jgi:hypothetical protein